MKRQESNIRMSGWIRTKRWKSLAKYLYPYTAGRAMMSLVLNIQILHLEAGCLQQVISKENPAIYCSSGRILRKIHFIPGPKKINLHPIYGDFKGKKVDRDQIGPEHFESWADWAQKNNAGIDFNPTTFAHKMADSGYTISDKDKKIRNFWIEHARRCREISNYFGSRLGKTCIYNIWVQDGAKDTTLAKYEHRMIMKEALDEIFSEKYPESNVLDALESKLFGLGSESFTVGSLDFYLAYAAQNGKLITFDTGHFHPTELVSDKISAVLPFLKGIMLHLSRGIRWTASCDHNV